MKISKNLRAALLTLSLVMLVVLVTVSIIVFHNKVTGVFRQLSIQSISEVQDLYTQALQAKFSDLSAMLEAQARYFSDEDLSSPETLKKIISKTKGIGDFKKVAIASKDGVCTNYTGQSLANVRGKPYFTRTINTAQPQVSSKIELDENLEPTLSLTYPIMNGNKVDAVIIGTLSYGVLKNLFSVAMFSGTSYTYIIANDGNIILCNKDKQRTLYNVNFYEYLKNNTDEDNPGISRMKIDVMRSDSNFMIYNGKDSKKVLTYAPLGINDWYIVSVMPFSYILHQQASISVLVGALIGIIMFTVFIFLFVVFLLLRKNSSIEKDNERLTIANDQSQSLIFEYDIAHQAVEFSGDTQFILGSEKKNSTIDFIRTEYFRRIHSDDAMIMQDLHNAIAGNKEDFTAEFRYKTFENEYVWLRMTGTLIKKEDGTPRKFIGTINNVNAQVMKEQELKSIAETDRLTGLLNKSAMESKVKDYLAAENDDTTCALFIIDLDNFKKVNDTLGHLIGDMAILDAAKKLSLIFSEKDLISRFGGDEFCILLRLNSQFDKASAKRVIQEKANNICMLLKEDYFDEKNCIEVSASVGIAMYSISGESYEELFQTADSALYEVKQHGKNGYRIA